VPLLERARFAVPEGAPVFFGHYRWQDGPLPVTAQLACVDNGVDKGRPLCAYRLEPGAPLTRDAFVASRG
jgi:hypothetical protein